MRTYRQHSNYLVNESIFSIFNRDKNKNIRKPVKASDPEMIELIEDVKETFDINKLKYNQDFGAILFTYILNDQMIGIQKYYGYTLKINKDVLNTDLISKSLLDELWDFFDDEYKKQEAKKNTEYFSNAITSRRNANKYNL